MGEIQTATPEAAWYQQLPSAAWWALALAGSGWLFESYDSFMLSLTLPVLAKEISLSRPEVGAILSITAAGQILGGIAFGYISDRLGRVRTAYVCVFIYSVFSGLIAFSPSATWLAALRFCGALGMGGTWTAGAALVAETWGPKFRGRGGAYMQMGLPLGAIVAITASAIVGALYGGLEGHGWRILYPHRHAPGRDPCSVGKTHAGIAGWPARNRTARRPRHRQSYAPFRPVPAATRCSLWVSCSSCSMSIGAFSPGRRLS